MTREDAINLLSQFRKDGEGFLCDNTIEAFKMAIKALEQEPCDDEYIKVPKKALKYRTAGMVAYNTEWLKNHFDIERAVICGAQEPCEDVPDINEGNIYECSCGYGWDKSKVVRHHFCPNCGKAVEPSYNSIKTELKPCDDAVIETIEELPPAMSQWIPVSERLPEEYKTVMASTDYFAVFPEARYTKDGWEWAYESGSDYWEELANVIAWMPLPAPYKAESEGKNGTGN